MHGVCIHLTDPQSEIQWDYVVSHFKPDSVIVLGSYEPTGKPLRDARRDLDVPGERIILAPKAGRFISGEIPLNEFEHPEDALYIFGPDNGHLSDLEYDHAVYIPTDTHDEMYSWVAGAITLWHRRYG